MFVPFGPGDMELWDALDLSDRELYDLALLEMRAAGCEAALADMDVAFLDHAVVAFAHHHGDTRAARVFAQAWMALWHEVHPETPWTVHGRGGR